MVKVPSYSDIGKSAKELLYGGKDGSFQYDVKSTVTTKTSNGLTATLNLIRKSEGTVAPSLKLAYSKDKYTVDTTFTTSEKIAVNGSVADVAPGLKVSGSYTVPDSSSGKVTFDYLFPYLNLKVTAGLTSAPKIDASAATGYDRLVLGAHAGFDTSRSAITTWSLAAGYHGPDYQLAGFLLDKGATTKATFSHNYSKDKAIGVEVTRKLSGADTAIAAVFQKRLDGAVVKVKLDSAGHLSGLYETSLVTGEKIAISSQLNAVDLSKPGKWGVAVNLN